MPDIHFLSSTTNKIGYINFVTHSKLYPYCTHLSDIWLSSLLGHLTVLPRGFPPGTQTDWQTDRHALFVTSPYTPRRDVSLLLGPQRRPLPPPPPTPLSRSLPFLPRTPGYFPRHLTAADRCWETSGGIVYWFRPATLESLTEWLV